MLAVRKAVDAPEGRSSQGVGSASPEQKGALRGSIRAELDFSRLMPGVPAGQYPINVGHRETMYLFLRSLAKIGAELELNPYEIYSRPEGGCPTD